MLITPKFQKYLMVGYGEVDDGAFTSLAVGATKNLYEDLWNSAEKLNEAKAQAVVDKYLKKDSKFRKFFEKN